MNDALAERFHEMAVMLELLGENRHRVNAHARVGRLLEDLAEDATTMDREALMALDGVGEKAASKILEFADSGEIEEHLDLRKQVPEGLFAVLAIPGLGPKTVKALWQDLAVEGVDDLKRVIDDESILTIPRMGKKTVDNIRKALEFASRTQRLWIGVAMPIAESIVERLDAMPEVDRVTFAGSLRRGQETIGDIDILVATTDAAPVHEAFRTMDGVVDVIASGDTKTSVRLEIDMGGSRFRMRDERPTVQVDLRIVPLDAFGAALMYFTGSKEHNVRLRERAIRAGRTLNEYGLFEDDGEAAPQKRGVTPVASASEEDVFEALGLPWIPPELRQDRGELDLDETPRLVEVGDIRAELHAHTTASDGRMSIEELATRARDRGFHTIAVTDHSRSSAVANGLEVDRLVKHAEAVRATAVKGIRILAGSEVDILADGRLDYDDDLLASLDVVVASPHASLSQDPQEATKRLVRAIENPHVHILGHPTGRILNRRPGLSPDLKKLIDAAIANDVALEINAHWMRLDLRDAHVRAAMDAGCLLAIDCDVHAPEDYDNLRYGVMTGRRGWLAPDRCVNTWDESTLDAWLGRA